MEPIPQSYREFIASQLPEEITEPLLRVLETTEPSVAVRFNPAKQSERTGFDDAELQKVPWASDGYYLSRRPNFTLDPRIHQGVYYVQDASSMAVEGAIGKALQIIEEETGPLADAAPLCYLDACAAPGGKTTLAAATLEPHGNWLVVANEFDYRRAEILKENVQKWGAPNVIVTRGDTAKMRRLRNFFTIAAVDAPCSGEGMMRKDETARTQWSPQLVRECVERQREIVANVWEALRPGGFLIYSTCTFNRCENEEMVRWITETLNGEAIPVGFAAETGIVSNDEGARFFPHLLKGEGLFISLIRKSGELGSLQETKKKKATKARQQPVAGCKTLDSWLLPGNKISEKDGEYYAIDNRLETLRDRVAEAADTILPGTHIATAKGKSFIPAQGLASGRIMRPGAFSAINCLLPETLDFLRKQTLTCFFDLSKGYHLLSYAGVNLGFVNNVGNRCNNLYPAPWKILH